MTIDEVQGARDGWRRVATHFQGFDCVVSYRPGEFPSPRELAISIGKPDSQLETLARDAAALFCAARLWGAPLKILRAACERDATGAAVTLIGHALDVVAQDLVSHEMEMPNDL